MAAASGVSRGRDNMSNVGGQGGHEVHSLIALTFSNFGGLSPPRFSASGSLFATYLSLL